MVTKNLSDDSGTTAQYEILETAFLERDGSEFGFRIIVKTKPSNSKGFPPTAGNLYSLGLLAQATALEREIRRQELEAENPSSTSSTRAKP